MALIAHHDSTMKVVHKFTNPLATECIPVIDRILELLEPGYIVLRDDRAGHLQDRSIRSQQDQAYQKSLEIDRSKAELRQASIDECERVERGVREEARVSEVRRVEKRIRVGKIREMLGDEPTTGDIVRLSIRLVSGSRVVRSFAADADLKDLYDYVETCEDVEGDIIVVGMFPRVVFSVGSLRDNGFFPTATVVVEEV